MTYQAEYEKSINQPELFWAEKAADIPWYKKPSQILGKDEFGTDRWFMDGELNTCYAALDYHVESGRGEQIALYYDSPVTDTKYSLTYSELQSKVALFAGALADKGIVKGDRVIVYMPMVAEAVIAMLACARLGAVHSVVFGGFAPHELAVRIDDATPKAIISASCGIEIQKVIPYKEMLDEAISLAAHKPEFCVLLQRPQVQAALTEGRDFDWAALVADAKPAPCTPVAATDPLYILYTSGTTGKPKGVVRDNGGHAVALKYSMKAIYDMNPGEVFMAASDVGWVVGHSYIVYAPLLAGCTTVVYEGKPVRTPDCGAFWRLIEEYKIKGFFTAPTAFRAVKKEDPDGEELKKYDISSLKNLFLAGERLDPPTFYWLQELVGVPVVDHWWQTETGWAIASNQMGIEPRSAKAGSATVPTAGFNVQILDSKGGQMPASEQGSVCIQLPMPPGCLTTVYGDPERFKNSYMNTFKGYYLTGDGGYIDEEGYVFIMGRTDDVINVAGHRLSTGEMEEIIAGHPGVAECAVIGVNDELKGQLPVGLVIMKDGYSGDSETLEAELAARVRKEIGAIACYKQTLVVDRLPKTRSGKILRNILRSIADGKDYVVPSTIDDPASLPEIESIMADNKIGFAGR
ncbi:propionyl-CoA synthetase [Oceanospirillum multiglobuliferum]|uniref:Propionyl-CoA synthetase n=1 Tax=Oceanospirillum multiglobuliferum TaxID=64969 RepID=A0A1T4PUT7_9GAMM|nr:propionyl-CoA synthetase [Oceanospirillum multiglobuliferum]OPX55313.1 propionyl-CoA synthetase [Oceanospirillum multiglobuliferum]SJZ95106.1 propionyl-CoA synthetase [Oceanospirillum multiglobuliferum]